MAEETKQAIPSPEDRVEELLDKFEIASKAYDGPKLTACRAGLLSLVEELIPFCDSPCGHSSQYAYSEDGGKNIVCLICEREELKGQVAEAKDANFRAFVEGAKWWEWESTGGTMWPSDRRKIEAVAGQKWPYVESLRLRTAEAELYLLRKRKDYHAEYVEAVEAAEKARLRLVALEGAGNKLNAAALIMRCCADLKEAPDKEECQLMGDALRSWESALTPEPASQAAKEKK